jgi:hypothetical protein
MKAATTARKELALNPDSFLATMGDGRGTRRTLSSMFKKARLGLRSCPRLAGSDVHD